MEYHIDQSIEVDEFLELVNCNWPGNYDNEKVRIALARTINLSARDQGRLVGCLRILTDGYLFSTIPDAFVLPERQGEGIGAKLFELAKEVSPTSLFFGSQPEKVGYYEKLGFEKSLPSFQHKKPRP